MFGRNPLRDGSPGRHLPAPDELKECGVDRQRIEAGDADEGAVEGALPHLQGVEACPAHGVPACQGHRRLLCCLRHRNCCLVVLLSQDLMLLDVPLTSNLAKLLGKYHIQ